MTQPFEKRILRHGEPKPKAFVGGESPFLEEIAAHITSHIGEPQIVIHEVASEYVHVDVHVVPPRAGRDFYTLVTSGMSNNPMNVPEQAKGMEFAELMLCLPKTWELKKYQVLGSDPGQDWPVNWLRQLARFPEEFDTWLGWGHSIPNGNPAAPLAEGNALCGWVLLEPRLVSDSFKCLARQDGAKVFFHAAVPVYREEIAFKIADGAEKLEALFGEYSVY